MTPQAVAKSSPVSRLWLARMLAAAAIIFGSVAAACLSAPDSMRWHVFWRIVCGPAAGWLGAAEAHAFPSALQVTLPATMSTVPLLVFHAFRGSRWALIAGTALWLFWGWYFAIGMWV